MTKLLLRLFVKGYQKPSLPAVHSAIGKLASIIGILCNALLFAGKLLVGLVSGSLSITADAANNLSDASSSVITLLGFRMARQPADKEHPYGHGRYEYLSGLVVLGLIFFIGISLAINAIKKIVHPISVEFSAVIFIILIISIATKVWLAVFFKDLSRKIKSTALKTASVDSRNDAVATAAVLVGGIAEHSLGVAIDGYIGFAVAIFILYSAISITKDTTSPLLGKRASPELVERITAMITSHEKILGVHDMLIHDYGPGQCFASVHAEIDASLDAFACHEIIDSIERKALDNDNIHLVIHYDPIAVDNEEWNEMRGVLEEIIGAIHPEISMHGFRILGESETARMVFDLAVPYSLSLTEERIKEEIDTALLARGKKYITEIRFDKTD